MTDSDRPSVPPRAMTPYEWSTSSNATSSSKFAAAKPIDPLAAVARLFPRDARTPSNPSEFERERQRHTSRDTEPTDLFASDDEKTPADRPFEIRVERELKELREDVSVLQSDVSTIKSTSREGAQHAIDTYELVKAMNQRQQAFEFERKWVPRIAWLVTTLISLWALYRTYR